jgi:hypothetical protein
VPAAIALSILSITVAGAKGPSIEWVPMDEETRPAADQAWRDEMRREREDFLRHIDTKGEELCQEVRAISARVRANTEAIGRLRLDLRRELDERFDVFRRGFAAVRRDIAKLRKRRR